MRLSKRQLLLLATSIILMCLYTVHMTLRDRNINHKVRDGEHWKWVFGVPLDTTSSSKEGKNNSTKHCNIYDFSLPMIDRIDMVCVPTKTQPSFQMCLFDEFRDHYISHDIKYTGIWEPQILGEFQEVLSRDPSLGVLDIGANLGIFSLLAAKMGRRVVSVEPNLGAVQRLHKSLRLNNLEHRVILLHNGMSDTRSKATILTSGVNQGDVRIRPGVRPCLGDCPQTVQLIVLDDLLEVMTFKRAIMKIDIQGDEFRAFVHSSKLLEKIHVPYIFMEWALMKEFHNISQHATHGHNAQTVTDFVQYLASQSFEPYSLAYEGGRKLDMRKLDKWPHDMVWRKKLEDDVKEKLLRNHFKNWPLA